MDKNLAEELSAATAQDRWPGFAYNKENLIESITPACHAAASHNVLNIHKKRNMLLPFKIEDGPLVFFSVLCDELQKWHRSPVGPQHLSAPFQYCAPKESDIYLQISSFRPGGSVDINCINKDVCKQLVDSVLGRLDKDSLGQFFQFFGKAAEYRQELKITNILKQEMSI